ncbi:MAG: protein kinase domain-containing protein, partial [Dehalococcoidia bacterium]
LIAAARNEIVRSRKSGELMDIAMKAMSTRPKDRHATVQELQAAIRGYLSHTESITLSTQAEDDLRRAAKTDDYQDFSQALFGYKEALKLWDGNTKARDGLVIARLGYAESAYHKGDYELGIGLLDLALPSHATLHREIQDAIAERDARQQRLNAARRIGRCLIALVFVVVTGAAVWVNSERREAERQREQAVLALDEAERQTEIANEQRALVEKQRLIAEQRRREAEDAREQAIAGEQEAQKQAELAQQREREADDARQQAMRQTQIAEAARQDEIRERHLAQAARKAEAYQGYIARIGLAAAKIRENAFGTALELLQQCRPQKPEDRDERNWEWGRLMHLC